MADIIAEINTIGDLIAPVSDFTRFYKQTLPLKYVNNTVGIRWQGDSDERLTSEISAINRIYQVVYFGNSEVNCLQNADKIRAVLTNTNKAKLRDSDGYMTFESFNYSTPFKTETDGVYAIVGVLLATIYVQRPQVVYPKMATIDATINENGGGN